MHALITVRTSSTRLPNKCFLSIGGIQVLDFVSQRASSSGFTPIICTSTSDSDDPIQSFAENIGLAFFRGSLENKVSRWAKCAEQFNIEDFIVIDADDPYFDPNECKESLLQLRDEKLEALLTSKQSDSGEASVGSSFTSSFMSTLAERTSVLASQNLDVIPWDLLLHQEDKVQTKTNKDSDWPDTPRFRLTLDYPEDLTLFDLLASKFGPGSSRKQLEDFLISNPDVVSINSFRSSDFIGNKKTQIEKEFGSR